jgi:exonuclease III
LRNKEDKLVIGTWNVKTLLKPGKMQELSEELHKTQMKIVALQEMDISQGRRPDERLKEYMTGSHML